VVSAQAVTPEEVAKHIDDTNPHVGGSRDAWGAMPIGWERLIWSLRTVPLADLPQYA